MVTANFDIQSPRPGDVNWLPSFGARLGSATQQTVSRGFGNINPLLGIGTQLADTAIGAAFNQIFAKRNAKLQYKMWKKMFDYQAEYNSPVEQMKRLYQAGINPLYNSEYGGQQSFQGGIGSLPESLDESNFSGMLEKFLSLMQNERTIDISENRSRAQNANDYAQANSATANAKLTEIKSQTELNTALANIRAIEAQTDKSKKDLEYIDAQISQCFSFIRTQRQQVLQNWTHYITEQKNADTNYFNARSAYVIGMKNAVTNQKSQENLAEHYKRADEISRYDSKTHRFSAELEARKFQRDIKMQDWQSIRQAINDANFNVFGVKVAREKDVQKMVELYEALSGLDSSEIDKLPKDIGMSTLEFLSTATMFLGSASFLKSGGSALVNGASKAASKFGYKGVGFGSALYK